MATTQFDTFSFIMAYEQGEIETIEELADGFQHLIDSGVVWGLQGSYGRAAMALAEEGWVTL